uniref:Retrotransposon protein, putative, Ty3-gypsy subclass n=1 Tax=Oryza sativa subsp. japonica TaxID=39947 RepID=Q2QMM7_ORYSJ|nr:hypothetical protein LOC_Os12g40640 [Oryza sativa Japonica Group]
MAMSLRQEVRKRGGTSPKLDNLEVPNLESEERINEYELSENIDNYYISNSNIECIGLQAFAPNWYRDIKSKRDIEKIIQRLEDIQIIGEIPMKYWKKNAIECKINIINPEYIIKTSPIEATPKDIEEFKMHIEELLKLGAIRESRSPHRSAAFIVRNHAEEVRGEGKIHLQEHIAKKILQFPDAMNDKKKLQQFLGLVNYARNHINNLAKLGGPLYAKLRKNDREIMAIINAINAFRLYLGFKEFTVRIDCEAICRYYNQLNSKKSSTRRWVLFEDIITGNGYKVIFEHIKGKDNNLPDMLSRLSELQKPIYVVFDGKLPGVYVSFEEIVAQKIDAKLIGGISWKKYKDIDEALSQARKILGINYYLELAAKEYIQKCKKAKGKKTPEIPIKTTIKEEGYSKKPTYKECLTKGVDPLDGEYIHWKIIEKFEEASPQLKKELKEEILKELKQEMDQKFEQMKKAVDEKLEVSFSDLDTMDLGGHGQPDE